MNMRDKGRSRPDSIDKVKRALEELSSERSATSSRIDAQFAELTRKKGALPPEVREFIGLLAKAGTPEERDRIFELANLLDRMLP